MSRTAKPIEMLLKLKQIKPDIEFTGADAIAYQEFVDAEAEENLISAIREAEITEVEEAPKKTTKRKSKKVKQTIDPEIVETGEVVPDETIDYTIAEEIRPEESN